MIGKARQSNPMVVMVDEIMRVHGRLKSIFSGASAALGLSSMESTVLTAVVEAHSAPTVPQIGRSLGHPRQVIQRAATALVAAGLIATAPNPNHKRAPLLLPTRRGQKLKDQSDTLAIEAANALLKRLDKAKCRRIANDLGELRAEIEAYLRAGNRKS
ncbi:MAG: MarR family transcriptional regulator [Rhodospirillaceae bacterium]|nr:MAG: MarR family transcriptional regulator [Rhodospirillaceae bacterium]